MVAKQRGRLFKNIVEKYCGIFRNMLGFICGDRLLVQAIKSFKLFRGFYCLCSFHQYVKTYLTISIVLVNSKKIRDCMDNVLFDYYTKKLY